MSAGVTNATLAANTACNTNQLAGLDATATNINSDVVESVTVGAGSAIAVALRGTGDTGLDADALTFTPSISANGSVSWNCSVGNATSFKFVPQVCRSTTGS
ncbi:hypothetical protein D9M70_542210 [compost metagenome]